MVDLTNLTNSNWTKWEYRMVFILDFNVYWQIIRNLVYVFPQVFWVYVVQFDVKSTVRTAYCVCTYILF